MTIFNLAFLAYVAVATIAGTFVFAILIGNYLRGLTWNGKPRARPSGENHD